MLACVYAIICVCVFFLPASYVFLSTFVHCSIFSCDFTSRGADISAADNNSYTPLMTAAANGQVSAFNLLRERGAKLDRLDRDGKSIVFLAAEANHVPVLKVHEINILTVPKLDYFVAIFSLTSYDSLCKLLIFL